MSAFTAVPSHPFPDAPLPHRKGRWRRWIARGAVVLGSRARLAWPRHGDIASPRTGWPRIERALAGR